VSFDVNPRRNLTGRGVIALGAHKAGELFAKLEPVRCDYLILLFYEAMVPGASWNCTLKVLYSL
jgi:hypothetical protein